MSIPTIRKDINDRSREIRETLYAHLEKHGETSLIDLAKLVDCTTSQLSTSRIYYNLALSHTDRPLRFRSTLRRGRSYWTLYQAPRFQQTATN